jgi:hypothetical protein
MATAKTAGFSALSNVLAAFGSGKPGMDRVSLIELLAIRRGYRVAFQM